MYGFWIVLALTVAPLVGLLFARNRSVRATRMADEADKRFKGMDSIDEDQSPHGVCERLAATLEANAIVVERMRGKVLVVAGAPWKAEVDPLDKIALDWSFTTGLPPKAEMGSPFSSDWLFLPVQATGRVVAVLGLMARHGRRNLILNEQPAIRSAVTALERIYRSKAARRPSRVDSRKGVPLVEASGRTSNHQPSVEHARSD